MPEFGTSRRPPKAPLSHISEERSSQMAGSSLGNTSRDRYRPSRSNDGTYSSSEATRRQSNETRQTNSFDEIRHQARRDKMDQLYGVLPPYVDDEENGSENSNLPPLPTQKQMNERRRPSLHQNNGSERKGSDPETPRSNRSMCTMEQLSARSESEDADSDLCHMERVMEYLDSQLSSSAPPEDDASTSSSHRE